MQRDQAQDLGLLRSERGQHAAQTEGLGAELGPQPVLARGGRVALVEDQVDDLEHGVQPRRPVRSLGTSKGTPASAIVFLARTMRCAMVGSGTT